jgi:hypothetical protein
MHMPRHGTVNSLQRFCFREKLGACVMYPWPTGEFDNAMDVALDIAMELPRPHGTGGDVQTGSVEGSAGNNGGLERRHAAPD